MITTTLKRIRKYTPCSNGWEKLISHLGQDFDRNQEFPISIILASNGAVDTVWAARAAIQAPLNTTLALTLATVCAEAVLPIFETAFPTDDRPRLAIEAAKNAAHYTRDANSAAARAAVLAATKAANTKAAHDAAGAAVYTAYAAATKAAKVNADRAVSAAAYATAAAKASTAAGSNVDLVAAIKKVLYNLNAGA